MNGRPLTEAQIATALRSHLPERARAGLSARILASTEATSQERALPSFLGALSDADPGTRRRSMLMAAALLVAVALASAAAVGALRLMDRDPTEQLSLEPPADVQEFVEFSGDRMPELPPMAITTLDSDDNKNRIYVDRSGAVRIERYSSSDATEPVTSMVLSGNRFGRTVTVGTDTVWVEQDEAIGEDPRVYLLGLSGLGRGGGCESPRTLTTSAPRPRRAGDTSVPSLSPGGPPTMWRATASCGWTTRRGSSCAAGTRSSTTPGSRSLANSRASK